MLFTSEANALEHKLGACLSVPLEPLARVPRHLGDARAAIEAACCPAMASVFHFISRFARPVFGDVFFWSPHSPLKFKTSRMQF